MSSSGVNLESYLIPLEEINRATDNFSQQRRIGDGGFGVVYKGQLSERWQNSIVAIKRRDQESHQGKHEFHNELEMISRFHHENIISFIGYCDEGNEMIIVCEYATNGSLDHHLREPNKMRRITWIQRLKICIGAARGLNYLHSGLGEHTRVIHRDVKSANILLDANFVAKICDFGLSKLGPRNQPDTELYTKVAGTQFYLDPTYHESRILRKESDVYSFGVVLFEIMSGMLVYRERSIRDDRQFLMNSVRRYHEKESYKLIDPNIRDQIDIRSFYTYKEVAYQCISFNLMERPTLDIVINKIEEALIITLQIASRNSRKPPAERSEIQKLICKLNSVTPYEQLFAGSEIVRLSYIKVDNHVAFGQSGYIPLLTNLLTTSDSRTQQHAMTSLFNLSVYEDNKDTIMLSGAVPAIVQVLKEGSMRARQSAAITLYSLSKANDSNKVTIGAAGAIPPLVSLLSEGTHRGKEDATIALYKLCLYQGNRVMAVRAGVIPILVELIKKGHGTLKERALVNLAIFATHPEGNLAIGKAEVVPILVDVIGSGSPNSKENAARILVELCYRDSKYLLEAQQHGVLGNLTDLLHHGRDKGKRIAKELLEKIEDQHHDHYPSHAEIIGVDRNQIDARFNIPEGAPRSSSSSVKSDDDN